MNTPKLSVILPTYNESQTIVKLIKTIHSVCKNISHEIIIVDDLSSDDTLKTINTQLPRSPWLRLYSHPAPRSLGLSIRFGITKARGRICIGMDADGNHDPQRIVALLTALKKADLVVASRFLPGGGMSNPLRYWASKIFNLAIHTLLNFPTTDSTSGYYAIGTKTLRALPLSRIYYGYGDYHMRLVWMAHRANIRITEIPVFYPERLGGESKSHLLGMLKSYVAEAIRLAKNE